MSKPGDTDIEQLIVDFQRSGLRELHVRRDGLEIYLSTDADAAGLGNGSVAVSHAPRGSAAAADRPVAAAALSQPVAPADLPDGAVIVSAPYLGTFYRSPKPGSDPYVEIGRQVEADSELCLVEVMKLFTAVRAGTAGTVHAVFAKDGEMVTAEQPLFAIVPA